MLRVISLELLACKWCGVSALKSFLNQLYTTFLESARPPSCTSTKGNKGRKKAQMLDLQPFPLLPC